ncbi:MAG: hypothetical protein ACK40G_14055 [Cytophagaceae bacterium]
MKNLLVVMLLMVFATTVNAQKIKQESGNQDFLKGQSEINIVYVYDGMKIGRKGKPESEYTAEKVADHNKKEPGKGDKWLENWKGARTQRYEPKFEELINDVLSKKNVKFSQNSKAKYTLIVKTTMTEPGFKTPVASQPALADFEFIFVETENLSKELSKMSLKSVMGAQAMGFDFDAGSRIQESYAKAGKMLGKHLAGTVFK